MELTGHIKVLGGPDVARGPDVAQAWCRGTVRLGQDKVGKVRFSF